jgi:hypothetical protein
MGFPERSRIEAKLVPEPGAPPNVTDSDCGSRIVRLEASGEVSIGTRG